MNQNTELMDSYYNQYNTYPSDSYITFYEKYGRWPSEDEANYYDKHSSWPTNSSSGSRFSYGSSSSSTPVSSDSTTQTTVNASSTSTQSNNASNTGTNQMSDSTVTTPSIRTEKNIGGCLKVSTPEVNNGGSKSFVTVTSGTGSVEYTGGGGFAAIEESSQSNNDVVYARVKDYNVTPEEYAQSTKAMLDENAPNNDGTLLSYAHSLGTKNQIARAVALAEEYEKCGEEMPVSSGLVALSDGGAYIDNPSYPNTTRSATSDLTVDDCKKLAENDIGVAFFQHHKDKSSNSANALAEAQSFSGEELVNAENYLSQSKSNSDCAIIPKLVEADVDTYVVDVNWEQAKADGITSEPKYHNATNDTVQKIFLPMYNGEEGALDPLDNDYIKPQKAVLNDDGEVELVNITSYHDLKTLTPGYYENWLEDNNDKIYASDGTVLAYQAGNGESNRNSGFNKSNYTDPSTITIEYEGLDSCLNEIKKTVYDTDFLDNSSGLMSQEDFDLLKHNGTATINGKLYDSYTDYENDYNVNGSESNTAVPAALLSNQDALFNASSNLLSDIWSDCDAISSLAKNYQNLDLSLENCASLLNDFTIADNMVSGEVYFSTNGSTAGANKLELFCASDDYELMNVSSSDLDTYLNATISRFDADNADADATINAINALKNEISTNEGDIWTILNERLDGYNQLLNLRKEANRLLEEAYKEASNYIKEYMSPYDPLKGSDIPGLNAEVSHYDELIEWYRTVIRATYTYVDSEGKSHTNFKYPPAMRIAAYNLIPVYEAKKQDCLDHIAKIEGLPQAMQEATDIINRATLEISNLYVEPVSEINVLPIIES